MNKMFACFFLLTYAGLMAGPSSESTESVTVQGLEQTPSLPLQIPPMTSPTKQGNFAPTSDPGEVVFALEEDQTEKESSASQAKAALEKQSKRKYFSISLPLFSRDKKETTSTSESTALVAEESLQEKTPVPQVESASQAPQMDSLSKKIEELENRLEDIEHKKETIMTHAVETKTVSAPMMPMSSEEPLEVPEETPTLEESITLEETTTQVFEVEETYPDLTAPSIEPVSEIQETSKDACALAPKKKNNLFANIAIGAASAAIVVISAVLGSN